MKAQKADKDYFDLVNRTYSWITRNELIDAIAVVKSEIASPDKLTNITQQKLASVLGQRMLRDFTGYMGSNVLLIGTGVESQFGETSFYEIHGTESLNIRLEEPYSDTIAIGKQYMDYTQLLSVLTSALKHFDKQNLKSLRQDPDGAVVLNPNTGTEQFKQIQKKAFEAFDLEVVSMLVHVNGNELSVELSCDGAHIFVDDVTDALFYAWSVNAKVKGVRNGCLYDYLISGDTDMLK